MSTYFATLTTEAQNEILNTCEKLMPVSGQVPREFMYTFLCNPAQAKAESDNFVTTPKLGGVNYYQLAVEIAKALCQAASVICPIVNNL